MQEDSTARRVWMITNSGEKTGGRSGRLGRLKSHPCLRRMGVVATGSRDPQPLRFLPRHQQRDGQLDRKGPVAIHIRWRIHASSSGW